MQVKIYEEFPTEKNLSKLKLIDFNIELIIAASNLSKFREYEKKVKKNKNVKAVGYWPTLKKEEGYWISPWGKREGLIRILNEIKENVDKGEKLFLKWDAEAPWFMKKSLYITEFFKFFGNVRMIKKFFRDYKSKIRIITAEKPNILPEWFNDLFGMGFHPEKYGNEKVKMMYTSLGKYAGSIGAWIFKKWYRRVVKKWGKRHSDKFVIGIGCTAIGILGDEPLITKEEFERDLKFAKENGMKKVAIFRLGGLDKEFVDILKNYL
ncbi:MAG: hypothetical protein CMH62_01215 [Nanoarchaeota archaeon]|nr:hypothetical protein [Nanoarchaeota archaeon]|tara:strand:- start:909 stop:1703 length:795 start_codon:yes stop_codon:yes gene_type:complete